MKQSFNDYLAKLVTNAKRAQMRRGVASAISDCEAARKGIKRDASYHSPNLNRDSAKQPLHHFVFCTHEVPYWRACAKCGRDAALAARNAEMILRESAKLVTVTK